MKNKIKQYLADARTMQLASVAQGKPWICTVYFVYDDELNLYWLSLPSRRHSKEIDTNNRVAVAIQIKLTQPVIGFQAEGRAEVFANKKKIKDIWQKYVEKYDTGKDFYENFLRGTNQHQMYKFCPSEIVLFDEVSNKDNPRQQLKMT